MSKKRKVLRPKKCGIQGQWLAREGYGHGNGLLEWMGGVKMNRTDQVKENREKGTESSCVIISRNKYLLRVHIYSTL